MLNNKRSLHILAESQAGYFSAQQAIHAGYAHSNHAYHVRCGNWLRVDRGLFRLPGYAETVESEFIRWSLWADAKPAASPVVVGYESALYYYGLTPVRPAAVHLVVAASCAKKDVPQCVLHRCGLEAGDVRMQPGFCITTPLRTLRDLKPDLVLRCQWDDTLRLAHSKRLLGETGDAGLLEEAAVGAVADKEYAMPSGQSRSLAQYPLGTIRVPSGGMPPRRTDRSGIWRGSSGFALVELLVVVAIISVLAAMLMPVLRKAVTSAKVVSCQNNIRQLGSMFIQYSTDNHNSFAPVTLYGQSTLLWWGQTKQYYSHGALYAYSGAGSKGIYDCPASMFGSGFWCQDNKRAGKTLGEPGGGTFAESGYTNGQYALDQLGTTRLNRLPSRFAIFSDALWAGIPPASEEAVFTPETVQHEQLGFNICRLDNAAKWVPIEMFINNHGALDKRNTWAANPFQPSMSAYWSIISAGMSLRYIPPITRYVN